MYLFNLRLLSTNATFKGLTGEGFFTSEEFRGERCPDFFSPFDHSRHFEYKVVFFTNALLSRFCIKKSRHRERAGISDDVKTLTSYRCCLPPIPRPGLVLTLGVSSGFYIYGLPPSIKEQLSPLISIYKQPAYQQEIPNRSARVEFVSITDYSFTSSFPRPSSLTGVFSDF